MANEHLGLVHLHLRTRVPTPRQPKRSREYDDLFQEGSMALMRAAARYDPKRHGPFPAYALPRIRGAVHIALTERFSMIHIPTRARMQAIQSGQSASDVWPTVFDGLDEILQVKVPARSCPSDGQETIRHALRRRYERAVQHALAELRSRRWPRRNPTAIMARIAAERLLISEESGRTPLRQIARDFKVSSGRVGAYKRKLDETVREYFSSDPQVVLLVEFAGQAADRFDATIDDERRECILQAELSDFEQRFAGLSAQARAELTYRLIERTASAVEEVARNLYRITLSENAEAEGGEPTFVWAMSA